MEEFIVNKIWVIAFNMNPRITEVTLDSLIRIIYIIFTKFARKLNSRAHNFCRYSYTGQLFIIKRLVCCVVYNELETNYLVS